MVSYIKTRTKLAAFVGLGILLSASSAIAQDPAQWKATPKAKTVAAGSSTTVKLSGKFDEGWYIYSLTQGPGGPIATRVTLPDSALVKLGGKAVATTEPSTKFDENFGINVEKHNNSVDFEVPVSVLPTVKPGAKEITVAVRYQACNDTVCLPPKTKRVKVPLTVTAKTKK